jgi:hypothetical protein
MDTTVKELTQHPISGSRINENMEVVNMEAMDWDWSDTLLGF